jgi:uroporphyrin-3 C-methyltransferase
MSTEIESLTTEMSSRRAGSGMSPMLVVFAVVALVLAIYAHWRFGQFDERIDRVHRQVGELRAAQDRMASQLSTLSMQAEQSDALMRSEIKKLREVPGQVNELGQSVAELRARTEAPQRTWVRAEALYLLELANRRLLLEHDIPTAIAAMESADARLATVADPAVADVRRQLATELATLRSVPVADLAAVITRISTLEAQTATLPVLGVPVAAARRTTPEAPTGGMLERAMQRISQALGDLFSLRRVDPANVRLVTGEEESLRRQHLELLLFSARIAAMQQDRPAFVQSLRSADAILEQFFEGSATGVAAARVEIAALSAIDIDPPHPEVGTATQLLQRVMRGATPTTP